MATILEKITTNEPNPTFTVADVLEDQATHIISNLWIFKQGLLDKQQQGTIEAIRDDVVSLRSALRITLDGRKK